MNRAVRALSVFLIALTCAPLFAAKIEHSNVVEPKTAAPAPEGLSALGQPTRLAEHGGNLYIAGTAGIAAVSPDGKLLWSTSLDPTGVREISVKRRRSVSAPGAATRCSQGRSMTPGGRVRHRGR